MADKPKLKYTVVTGKNPATQATVLRPLITGRSTYYINSVIQYALNASYVRGQIDDMTGVVRGFFRACKELVNSGVAVNLADWIRIHPELTGSLDDSRQLDATRNGIKVAISPLSEMKKLTIDDFSWQSTEDTGKVVKVDSVFSVGSEPGNIVKNQGIMFTGKNLQFSSALGDKVTVEYEGLSTPINMTPTENDYAHQKFQWPSLLDEIDDGTILIFKLKSRAGISGAPDQVVTKMAVYHAA